MQTNTASSSPRTILATLEAPPIRVLPVAALGLVDRGWTRGHITCSFDEMPKNAPGYLDYGILRLAVIENMDPGAGYPMHAHEASETIAIVLSGAVAHEDTLSSGVAIAGPNDVAVTSAGVGMSHSEMTHGTENAHVVMFWLQCPDNREPSFERRTFERTDRKNRWAVLASGRPSARDLDAALPMRSDACVCSAMMDGDAELSYTFARGRCGYILAPNGAIDVNGVRAEKGDRVLVTGQHEVILRASMATEVILLDLPEAAA